MATVSRPNFADQLSRAEKSHPLWTRTFNEDERWAMAAEDLAAGKRVATVLISVVSLGLLAIIITLLAVAL